MPDLMTLNPNRPAGGVRDLFAIAAPMVVSTGCDTVMIFTDRLFLAQLSPAHMNAALGGGLANFVTATLVLGLLGFTTALVAQHLGAGQRERCAVVTTQALLVALGAWPLLWCLRPLVHAAFTHSGVEAQQLALQTEFFDILNRWAGLILLRTALSGYFSGIGRTRVVMMAAVVAMVVNIVANWVMIFGHFSCPALGMAGSAWGSVIGGACGLAVLVVAYLEPGNRRAFALDTAWRFDWPALRSLLRFGAPGGVEMMLNLVAFNALILTYHGHGPVTATATTVMFNWDLVSFVPLIGLQIGVMSMVGRAMGAGLPDVAARTVRSGLLLGWCYSGVVLLAFAGIPESLVAVFRPGHADATYTAAEPLAVTMLRLAALYVLGETIMAVVSGALRGAGDTVFTMFLSVGMHWFLLPIAIIGLHVLGWTPATTWAVQIGVFAACAGLFWWRWHSGRWRSIRVVGAPEARAAGDHALDFHEGPEA